MDCITKWWQRPSFKRSPPYTPPDITPKASKLAEFPAQNLDLCELYRQLSEVNPRHESSRKKMELILDVQWSKCNSDCPSIPPSWSKNIEEECKKEEVIYQELDERQGLLRRDIDICSRPHIKSLSILDMPEEILVNIVKYTQGRENEKGPVLTMQESFFLSRPVDETGMKESIMNLRLTCRRLCNTSSRFLFDTLLVEFNLWSLSRLEEVSRHPIFGRGVRTVRLDLQFCDSGFASDIQTFALFQAARLHGQIDEKLGRPAKKIELERIDKAQTILRSWLSRYGLVLGCYSIYRAGEPGPWYENDSRDDLTPDLRDSADNDANDGAGDVISEDDALIEDAFQEYRSLFLEQGRMLENGTFVQAFATAVALMPLAKTLEVQDIHDDEPICIRTQRSEAEMYEALEHNMSVLFEPKDERDYELGKSPVDLLIKLPGALHKAGVSLTRLDIALNPPQDFSTMAPNEEDRCGITAAMQSLRGFNFMFGQNTNEDDRKPSEIEGLKLFLGAFLNTDSLEDIGLMFGEEDDFSAYDVLPEDTSTGSFINLRPWPKLQSLVLTASLVSFADLEQFIGSRATKMDLLLINNTKLRCGTWADVLDLLKNRTSHSLVWSPYGAEGEALRAEASRSYGYNDCWKMFRTVGYSEGRAGAYMRGDMHQNPIRRVLDRWSARQWREHGLSKAEYLRSTE